MLLAISFEYVHNQKISWGAVKHRSSILAIHVVVLGSILGIPKKLFQCCLDLLMARTTKNVCIINESNLHALHVVIVYHDRSLFIMLKILP